jgi:two-component system nitrate/nitrite response regulator NarL
LSGRAVTRVLIADNHPLYRQALSATLRRCGRFELTGECVDGEAALTELRTGGVDVAVLDLKMPRRDGLAVLEAARAEGIHTRVLILSGYLDSDVVYATLAAGAAGYLSKDTAADAICDAVAAVARGETVLAPELHAALASEIRGRAANDRPVLTAREQEIMRLTADGHSAREVAGQLYVSPGTVKTHLQNVYEKLGVSERAAAVAEAMRRGLLE